MDLRVQNFLAILQHLLKSFSLQVVLAYIPLHFSRAS